MDGKRSGTERVVKRVHEPHRLEEELWAAVYESIYPLVRRKMKQQKSAVQDETLEQLVAAGNNARRA